MKCTEVRALFSSYLDGAVTGAEMHGISAHLQQCGTCKPEYGLLENTRALVSSLGHRTPPPDLALNIRVALSNQRSRNARSILRRYVIRLENTFNGIMVPATAGILFAIMFFGGLIGLLAPTRVGASDDVPSAFYTPPRLEMSEYPVLDAPVVIETYVDANGRVENYRIISGPDDEQVREQLNRALLFDVFAPAQSFGHPVPGKVVMSFSRINVGG